MVQPTILLKGKVTAHHSDVINSPVPARVVDCATLSTEPKLLLTAAEAALACRTSLRTWRSWDSAGKIPTAVQLGRVKLWRPLELADWVAAGCPPRISWEWEPRV
jgi:hypothetical protein